jgi:transposase
MTPEELDQLQSELDPAARFVVALLREENAKLREQLAVSIRQLEANVEQIARLTEQLEDFKRRLFGRRSERIPTVAEELRREVAPDELTVDGEPMPSDPEQREKEKRRKARRNSEPARQRRRKQRKDIPVVMEACNVDPDELPEGYTLDDFRVLGDGKLVKRIEHVREHLIIQHFVLQTLASKDGKHYVTATPPPGVVDGGHYGPGLHAHVAVSRCDDTTPLYRSERALERAGYPVARSTLCALFHRTAEQLALIYEEMKRVVRRGRYVNADETTQRILAPEECFKGWMWTILSRQAIVYHYSDHRDSETAKELLGGTTGNLTSDGYSAYSCLSDKEASRNRSGCWGHSRRKFFEVMPKEDTQHENREVLDMIKELYRVEDEAEELGIVGTPEHLELRQRKSKPIVRKIWRWVDARRDKHSPSSKMGKALSYATKQRDKLEQFLSDPKLRLDNNEAERALRIVALGRKSSLFAGSAEHAQNLAVLLTLVATCRLHAVNPYEYIRDMLIRIQTHPASRIDELMPWRWRPPDS